MSDAQRWANIEGWPYEVSDDGMVRRTEGGKRTYAGRERKIQTDSYGYGILVFSRVHDGQKQVKTFTIHRLVAAAFLGPRPPGSQVNHINGVKKDNRAENLEYVTPQRNSVHAFEKGLRRSSRGEASGNAKITEADVLAIRAMRDEGRPIKEVAALFGIGKPAVSMIANRKTWTHVA